MKGKIISRFRKDPVRAYELFEIDDLAKVEDADVFVTVDVDGRRRKIQVFNPDDGVYFREELNGADKPALSDDEIVEYCAEEAMTLLERCGNEWLPEWSKRGR